MKRVEVPALLLHKPDGRTGRYITVMARKLAKVMLTSLLVVVIIYFYWQEFSRNQVDFSGLDISICFLIISILIAIVSYLVEVLIWLLIIHDRQESVKITISELVAIIFSSGLVRYIPGRMWTVAAQFLWMKKYDITKSTIFYINLVCMFQFLILSLYFGAAYALVYEIMPTSYVVLLIFAVFIANFLFIFYHTSTINKILLLFYKFTKRSFVKIETSPHKMFLVQVIFTASWLLTGLAVYFLARGVGLPLERLEVIPVIASMCLSWLASSFALIVPAGIGVREGVMLLLLKPVLSIDVALILPVATRILLLVSEVVLGVVALYVGVKRRVFAFDRENSG